MSDDFAAMMKKMLEQGQEMAKAFTSSFSAMPAMSKDMLETFFGKTYNPEGLDARTRFLVTVAALTVLGPVGEPQLRLTVQNALAAGASRREIAEVIWQMSMFGGLPAMQKALEIAQAVFAETDEKTGEKAK